MLVGANLVMRPGQEATVRLMPRNAGMSELSAKRTFGRRGH